jgi:hypothetical protein
MTTNDNNRPPNANEITTELLKRVQQELPRVWLYRNNRVNARAIGKGGRTRHVSAGIDGQGDLSGLVSAHPDCICEGCPPKYGEVFLCKAPIHLRGRRIECEIKAEYSHGRDRQSPVQEAIEVKITSGGGIYLLIDRVGWLNGKPDLYLALKKLEAAINQ